MCDIKDCDSKPKYVDDMGNKLCEECKQWDMKETMNSDEDYELITNL